MSGYRMYSRSGDSGFLYFLPIWIVFFIIIFDDPITETEGPQPQPAPVPVVAPVTSTADQE